MLPELQVSSFEGADVCAACEQESCTVIDDDVVAEVTSKAVVEVIAEEAPQESSVAREDCIFGCFSPRARSCSSPQPALPDVSECEDITVIMPPVMQIMPDLQELCGEPSPSPLSMVPQQVDSLETSMVASTPPFHFVARSVKVNKVDTLASSSDVLFTKELCSLLISLEAAIPGSAKEIASILTDKATMGKIKKVKEYLRSKRKMCGAARKAHTVN
jgi:hypothetical protein